MLRALSIAAFGVILVLGTPPAFAQTLADTGVPLDAPGVASPHALGADTAERLLSNYASTATPTTRTYAFGGRSGAGYTFGTGPAQTKVAQAFTFPDGNTSGTALGADLYFYARSVTPDQSNYQVQIWSGSAQTGPQTELYSESFPIDGVQLDNAGPVPTQVRFSAPVAIQSETFFVVVPFDLSAVGDSLALVSTPQLAPTLAPESWHFVDTGWSLTSSIFSVGDAQAPLQSYAWIQAYIDDTPVAREALPSGVTSVRLFPNPTRAAGVLDLELSQASGVRVAILDLLGREVASVFSGTLPAGRRVIDLGAERLPGATYAVRIEVDGVPVTRLLSVTR